MEGTELSALMLSTCICGTLLYSSESPLKGLNLSRTFRSIVMGTAMNSDRDYYVPDHSVTVRSSIGRSLQSGDHTDFFWLRRVHRWDAACYIMAHFVGAVVGMLIAREILGVRLSAPPVRYLVTLPGSYGSPIAFLGEFLLSVLLMGVVLYASNHRLLTRFTPVFVALITVSYFSLSSSIAGFSVNPARSLSSALFAWIWRGIWIYFFAPCLGMLTAAAIYIRSMGRIVCIVRKCFTTCGQHVRSHAILSVYYQET